jgi:hypothetical protein
VCCLDLSSFPHTLFTFPQPPFKHNREPWSPKDQFGWCTGELTASGVQWYQEIIGCLRWAVELGRIIDILLETALMSQHLALPREGHLEQVLHIVGYIKSHKKFRILFDASQP